MVAPLVLSGCQLPYPLLHFLHQFRVHPNSAFSLASVKAVAEVFYLVDMAHRRFLEVNFQKQFSRDEQHYFFQCPFYAFPAFPAFA